MSNGIKGVDWEVVEDIRIEAVRRAGSEDEVLDFYKPGLELGLSEDQADAVDIYLTERIFRALGAL